MSKKELQADANALMDLEMMDTIVGGASCTNCSSKCLEACASSCKPGNKSGTTEPPTEPPTETPTPEPTDPPIIDFPIFPIV